MPDRLKFLDSSMHYLTAQIEAKFNHRSLDTIDVLAARYGTAGHLTGNIGTALVTMFENPASLYAGCAYKLATGSTLGQHRLHTFFDNGSPQMYAAIEADGRISIYNGQNTLLAQTTDFSVHVGRWYYIEVFGNFHLTTGSATVKVNMVTRLSVSGVRTTGTANNYMTSWRSIGQMTAGATFYSSDSYLDDTGFLGDIKVSVILPNGNTATDAWSRSAGGSTYVLLDEATPDESDYISSNTLAQQVLCEMQDPTLESGVCVGIQLLHYSWKTNANVRKMKHLLNSGGTLFPGPEDSLSDDGKYYRYCLSQDPATSAAWTEPNLANIKYGVELTL